MTKIHLIKFSDKEWLILKVSNRDGYVVEVVDKFTNRVEAYKKFALYKFVMKTIKEDWDKITSKLKGGDYATCTD